MTGSLKGSSGLLLVDKPAGVTSHTVVARVRKILLQNNPHWDPRRRAGKGKGKGASRPPRFKCGHAGTLDPLATGLLLVLVGKGSRLSSFLMGMDKSYLATVRFGIATDSLDADGQVTATAPIPDDPDKIIEQLPLFRGDILQVPPAVSALKFQGQPLYKLVRQGKPLPELKARPVTLSRLEVQDVRWQQAEMDLLVHCSSGTYIRSLARDLAQAAGTEGHLTALRRLDIGPFSVDDALSGIMTDDGQELAGKILSLSQALPHVPALLVNPEQAAALRQGTQPEASWWGGGLDVGFQDGSLSPIFRLVNEADELIAVGRLDEETGAPMLVAVIPGEMEPSESCD